MGKEEAELARAEDEDGRGWAVGLAGCVCVQSQPRDVLPPRETQEGLPGPRRSPTPRGLAGHAPGSLARELRRGSGSLRPVLPSGVGDIPWDQAVLTLHGDQRHRGLPEIPEGRENMESAQVRTDHVWQHYPSPLLPYGDRAAGVHFFQVPHPGSQAPHPASPSLPPG